MNSIKSSTTSQRKPKKKANSKPGKPFPDFPLYAHASKQWAKKIKGKTIYFGSWNDPKSAKENYEHYVLHGSFKDETASEAVDIRELCNRFLTNKKSRELSGDLSTRSFRDYKNTCAALLERVPKTKKVEKIIPADFLKLREAISKGRCPVTIGNEMQRVKSIFIFAYDEGIIDKPMKYGQSFDKPSKKILRQHRADNKSKHGKRMFEREELLRMIDAAKIPLKAMILLGVNCGLGNNDCGLLPINCIDFEGGWLDYARAKTGIPRRCKLWDETLSALKLAKAHRPKPKNTAHDELIFITQPGAPWTRNERDRAPVDAVGAETDKILRKLGIKRHGLGFYALRHTFQTIAEKSREFPAVMSVMGHADNSMSGRYREEISDETFIFVSDCVHDWLFKNKLPKKQK